MLDRLQSAIESWSLASRSDPSRVEAESTQASLHASAHSRAQARVACRSRTAEAILGTWVLPGYFWGIFRYVCMWPSRTTDCNAPMLGTTGHIHIHAGHSHTPGLMKNRSVLLCLAIKAPGRNMTLCSCRECVRALLHHGRSTIFYGRIVRLEAMLGWFFLSIDLHFGAQALIDSHVSLQAFDGESMLLPRMCHSPHAQANLHSCDRP